MQEEIICNQYFPFKRHYLTRRLQNSSIISIGGNLGSPIKTFISLFKKLDSNVNIALISTSPIYKNPPFGYLKQDYFYNATILLFTNLCLIEFYNLIFYLERSFGRSRIREFKNAPRILDIDILFFNDIFIRNVKINIPHLHWYNRKSVIVPLMYQVYYKGF